MKKLFFFFVFISILFQGFSQKTFFIELQETSPINCGDSILMVAELVSPVRLTFDHGYSPTDFTFDIIEKGSKKLIKRFLFYNLSSVDTTFFLKSNNYYLVGTVVPNSVSITGSIGEWIFPVAEYMLEFRVDTLVDSKNIIYNCQNIDYDLNSFKIAPNQTGFVKVTATYIDESTASDSVHVIVNPLTVNAGTDKTITCGEEVMLDNPLSNYLASHLLNYTWLPAEGLDSSMLRRPTAKVKINTNFVLTVTSPNGCIAKDSIKISVDPLTVNATDMTVSCGNKVNLNATTNYSGTENLTYRWSPALGLSDTTISNPEFSSVTPQKYKVEIETSNGCTAYDHIDVSASVTDYKPSICIVTVNEEDNNVIIWQKDHNEIVDSIFIYRESLEQTGQFNLIGKKLNTELNMLVDSLSNARIQSYRYKISAKDLCGFKTTKSAAHKTMHLNINKGQGNIWNLIWEEYEGFTVRSYKIYRGTTKEDLVQIGSTAGGFTSYTDLTAPEGNVYYQVEVISPNSCSTFKSATYSSSRSNIASNTNLSVNKTEESLTIFYPNPAFDKAKVLSYNQVEIFIFDMKGSLIRNQMVSPNEFIDISNLDNGFYLIKVLDNGTTFYQKFLKQ